jgi:hypothetical protein
MNDDDACVGTCLYAVGCSSLSCDFDCLSGGPLKIPDNREPIEEIEVDLRWCLREGGWRYSFSEEKGLRHFIMSEGMVIAGERIPASVGFYLWSDEWSLEVRQQAIAFSLEPPVGDTDQLSVSVDPMNIDDDR